MLKTWSIWLWIHSCRGEAWAGLDDPLQTGPGPGRRLAGSGHVLAAQNAEGIAVQSKASSVSGADLAALTLDTCVQDLLLSPFVAKKIVQLR